MTTSGSPVATVRVEGPLDADRVAALVREQVPLLLPAVLPGRRWFGEKDRRVATATVDDLAMVEVGDDWVAMSVVRVILDGGRETLYFVPLSLVAQVPGDASILIGAETVTGRRFLIESFATEAFSRWFLDRLGSGRPLAGERGRYLWEPLPGFRGPFASALEASPELGTAEQSNTSVRFGDALFLKVFRRLRAGPNPDAEIGRYLATRTGFRRLPLPLGTVRYVGEAGVEYPLALAQTFEPSVGDGWSFALRLLSAAPTELTPTLNGLGERTAQLHLALGQETDDAAFAPEIVSEGDARRWAGALRERLDGTAAELRRRGPALDPSLVGMVETMIERLPELRRRAEGFRREVGGRKIRVHGDYHLGQVLRTPDGDWTILDFEGEPARPIDERRAKRSPLKDVAGMLRSFGYARSAALRAGGDRADGRTALRAWEAEARAAFLGGYRATLAGHEHGLVPADEEGFRTVLAAWELDKAVYELRYELSNRPDWIGHALGSLVGDRSSRGEEAYVAEAGTTGSTAGFPWRSAKTR